MVTHRECVYWILYLCCAVLGRSVMSDSLQPHGLYPARLLCPCGFSRQEYWGGLPCPPPGDLPNPGIEPRSPELQADSSPSEPPEKPNGVGSLSLLQRIFLTQESNWASCIAAWFFTSWATREAQTTCYEWLKQYYKIYQDFLKHKNIPQMQPKQISKRALVYSTRAETRRQSVPVYLVSCVHVRLAPWICHSFAHVFK